MPLAVFLFSFSIDTVCHVSKLLKYFNNILSKFCLNKIIQCKIQKKVCQTLIKKCWYQYWYQEW